MTPQAGHYTIHKSYYSIILLFLFFCLFGHNGWAGGITETITSVSIPSSPQLIASSGSQSKLNAACDVDIVQFAPTTGATYRVSFQLFDDLGAVIPLANADTVDDLTKWSQEITLMSPVGTTSETFTAELEPEPTPGLSLERSYHVKAVIQQRHPTSGLFITQDGPDDSNTERIYHFKGTTSGDTAFNVLAELNQGDFDEYWLRQNDTNDSFEVTLDYNLFRFDDYSDPVTTDTVDVIFDVSLHSDAAGFPSIPLVKSSFTASVGMVSHDVSPLSVHEENNLQKTVKIRPADGEQLASYSDQHLLRVTIRHDDNGPTITGNTLETATERLYHFNGNLLFGFFQTEVTALSNDPATTLFAQGGVPAGLDILFQVTQGESINNAGYTYGDGSAIKVRLRDNGNAIALVDANQYALNPPSSPDWDEITDVRFRRDSLVLTATGVEAGTLFVQFPAGMGYSDEQYSNILEPGFFLSDRPLNNNLNPASTTYSASFPSDIYIYEEAHPVSFRTDVLVWKPLEGSFTFDNDRIEYVRKDELVLLADGSAPSSHKMRGINDAFYNYAVPSPPNDDIIINADSNKSAQLTAEIPLLPDGDYFGSFPLGATLQWASGGGLVSIVDDEIDTSTSLISGLTHVLVPYKQDCGADGDCSSTTNPFGFLGITPNAAELKFTSDGGLYASGVLNALGETHLEWGYIPALSSTTDTFAHKTDDFTGATFVMAGNHLSELNGDGDPANAPGILLLSGWDSGTGAPERPGTSGYTAGTESYPGINVKVANTGDQQALSTLGGTGVGLYDITDRSKFYARYGGISGILEADAGAFPGSATIWGYPFDFSSFALSFLSNVPMDSRTDGTVDLPLPSDFTVPFDDMMFDCLGALTGAEIAGGPVDVLASYWSADLDIHSMQFATPIACDPTTGYLLLGSGGYMHACDETLFGTLGFKSDGNIITQQDNLVPNLQSRLTPPNVLQIKGPGSQEYEFNSITGAWFDNNDNPDKSTTGRINLAGSLDVPYFNDMTTHIRASAKEGEAIGYQELAGGWDNGGNDLFITTDFDPDNYGLPDGVTEASYLAGGVGNKYSMRAYKEWFESVIFDYPLRWSGVSRTFESADPVTGDILVIEAEHQLTYMDAETAEIVFGVQYEGLPQINLANSTFDVATEQTGNFQSLVTASSSTVADALGDGVEAIRQTLDDQYDEIISELLDGTINPEIDDIYANLDDFYDPGGSGTFATARDAIEDAAVDDANSMNDHLEGLFTGLGASTSLISALEDRVQESQNSLLAVMDESSYENTFSNTLLTKDPSGNYLVLRALADEILNDNATELRAAFGNLDPLVQWDVLLGEILKEDAAGLESARDQLRVLYDELELIKTDLNTAGELVEQIRFYASPANVLAISDSVVDDLVGYVNSIDAQLNWEDYSATEVKDVIRQSIDDQIYQSALLNDIQSTVKHRLYDIESLANTTIDSIFASVNRSLRTLTREYLSPIDNNWNEFADDVNAVVSGADLSGYAHLSDDALRKLRMDLLLEFKFSDNMTFNGYFQICELSSLGDDGCNYGGDSYKEVTLGGTDVPVNFAGAKDMLIDAEAKFNFSDTGSLSGIGGAVGLSGGSLKFSGLTVEVLSSCFMMGSDENYFGGQAGIRWDGAAGYGGMFFGKSCTLAPLTSIDSTVAGLVGQPPFSGVYAYGEAHIPIFSVGCLFNVSVGAGVGAYLFDQGPLAGGRMSVAGSGKALCIAKISGRADLYGGLKGNSIFFSGTGRFEGKGGACPICVKFNKSVTFEYDDKWKVSF